MSVGKAREQSSANGRAGGKRRLRVQGGCESHGGKHNGINYVNAFTMDNEICVSNDA